MSLHPPEEGRRLSGRAAKKKAVFDQMFTDFGGEIGDTVFFKHATKNRVEWKVVNVETDWQACRWNKGQKQPMFIELERTIQLAGGKVRKERVHTCTNQLYNNGRKDRR